MDNQAKFYSALTQHYLDISMHKLRGPTQENNLNKFFITLNADGAGQYKPFLEPDITAEA